MNLLPMLLGALPAQEVRATFDGDRGYGKYGSAVAVPGDLDGDGRADFVIGAPGESSGHGGSGQIVDGYVQARAAAGLILWQVETGISTEFFGDAVAGIGDFDGDGRSEVAVGAPGYIGPPGGATGRVIVLSGVDGAPRRVHVGQNYYERLGTSLADAGDLNGDGDSDYWVGAPGFRDSGNTPVGRAYLFSGADGALLRTLQGEAAHIYFGYALANAGRVDGDNVDDVVIGAYSAQFPATPGRVYVYSGASGALLRQFDGLAPADNFGVAVAGVGDVDGGGASDILVGANNHDGFRGAARLFSSETGAVLWTGFGETDDDSYGLEVAGVGDVQGDGVPDFLVGAQNKDLNGSSFYGKYYVYSGASRALAWSRDGEAFWTGLGAAAAAAGDLDLDGYDEFLVGAYYFNHPVTSYYTGRVYLVSGGPSFRLSVPPLVAGSTVTARADGGVNAGELVYFGYSLDGQGPQNFGPAGLVQLTAPQLAGSAAAAGGAASLPLAVPGNAPSGLAVHFQAGLNRGGRWILSDAPIATVP